jgi:hypothetical protein
MKLRLMKLRLHGTPAECATAAARLRHTPACPSPTSAARTRTAPASWSASPSPSTSTLTPTTTKDAADDRRLGGVLD